MQVLLALVFLKVTFEISDSHLVLSLDQRVTFQDLIFGSSIVSMILPISVMHPFYSLLVPSLIILSHSQTMAFLVVFKILVSMRLVLFKIRVLSLIQLFKTCFPVGTLPAQHISLFILL